MKKGKKEKQETAKRRMKRGGGRDLTPMMDDF
jgi:hypothetical protein